MRKAAGELAGKEAEATALQQQIQHAMLALEGYKNEASTLKVGPFTSWCPSTSLTPNTDQHHKARC